MSDDVLREAAAPYQTHDRQSPYAALADDIFRERVLKARASTPEDKFLSGEELFEYASAITLEGIRNQNPDFTESDCRLELRRRLEWREKMDRRV